VDGKTYHYHLDHLGTPRELTDDQGKIVWKVRYKTYGNVAVKEVEEIENNLRFQGQYFDEETGLHYNRFRYYNPNTGQFITQDPIGLLGGVNNYQYAPNPVGWVDPFGLKCKESDPLLDDIEDFREIGLDPLNEGIPKNYDVANDRFERAILVLETEDPVVRKAVEALRDNHGIPVITKKNIEHLRDVKVLTIVGHGSGKTIAAGMSGKEMADFLKSCGIAPGAIDVVSCCRTPGPAHQELANEMGVPVRGAKGRTMVYPDGRQHTINEVETSKLGDANNPANRVYHLDQNQHEIFYPQKKDS
jgi:RHS repeat-associated protein